MQKLAVLSLIAVLAVVACANLFIAYHFGNSLLLVPSVAAISIIALFFSRKTWFAILFVLIFLDVRGEIPGGVPVHLWEIYILAATVPLFARFGRFPIGLAERTLFVLCLVAVISAVLNSSYLSGFKSALRWLEYLLVFRVVKIAASTVFAAGESISLGKIVAGPLLALAVFSIGQATVIKGQWTHVLETRAGALLMGPAEAKARAAKNNFGYAGGKGDSFRAPSLYLSAVDLSAVLTIAAAVVILNGVRSPLSVAAIACGGVALIMSMGRAALLYGLISMAAAVVMFQRRLITIACMGGFVVLLAVGVAVYAPARERLLTLTQKEDNAEVERVLIWQTGLNIWKSSPIYGKGGGSTASLFDNNASVDWLAGRQGSTHSTYIGTLAELGIMGLLAWVLFLAVLAKTGLGAQNRPTTKALLCFCWIFFVLMGVSSDTYIAGNPYFILLLIVFAWYEAEGLSVESETEYRAINIQAGTVAIAQMTDSNAPIR